MCRWIDSILLQDAALLDAAAWMPLARASSDAAALPEAALSLTAGGTAGLARIAFNLVVVLGVIVALAFIVRRAGAVRSDDDGQLRVSASLALGPKERLMIVEADGARVLIGAGSHGLQPLHVLPARPPAPVASEEPPVRNRRVFRLPREARQ